MSLIFESKKPKFAISTDINQWILHKRQVRDERKNKFVWTDNSYFPKLSLLLEELAEYMFRKFAKKVEKLEELDQAVEKVYKLIDRISFKISPDRKKLHI